MAGQDVFKGALGWDDWVWWAGLAGLGLFIFLLLLCCVVCVQRAKRRGREEALAQVQARERERQQEEQAQLRYAQAQQARYPSREPSYKYSKPEPPVQQFGAVSRQHPAAPAATAAVPHEQPAYMMNRPQPYQHQPRRGSAPVYQHQDVDHGDPVRRASQPVGQPKQQRGNDVHAGPTAPRYPTAEEEYYTPRPPVESKPGLRQERGMAAGPSRRESREQPPHGAMRGMHALRPQPVHQDQPPLLQYRRQSSGAGKIVRTDSVMDTFDHDHGRPVDTTATPFVAMQSPKTVMAPAGFPRMKRGESANEPQRRLSSGSGSSAALGSSKGPVAAPTLRDRIEALRGGDTIADSRLSDPERSYAPSSIHSTAIGLELDPMVSRRPGQRPLGTVLSDSGHSLGTDGGDVGAADDDGAFNTARSQDTRKPDRHKAHDDVETGMSPGTYYHRPLGDSASSRHSVEF